MDRPKGIALCRIIFFHILTGAVVAITSTLSSGYLIAYLMLFGMFVMDSVLLAKKMYRLICERHADFHSTDDKYNCYIICCRRSIRLRISFERSGNQTV